MTCESSSAHEECIGFTQLADVLKKEFPQDVELKLADFMAVEMVLTLALEVGEGGVGASKANRLLSNYALLRPRSFGARESLLQNARRRLLSLSSATTWRKSLRAYLDSKCSEMRFFDIVGDEISVRQHPFAGIDRRPLYVDYLSCDVLRSSEVAVANSKHAYRYYAKPELLDEEDEDVGGAMRQVRIPAASLSCELGSVLPQHKGVRDQLVVSLGEMISVAEDIGEKTGKRYYTDVLRNVLEQGLLKRVDGRDAKATDCVVIEQVVSLVGLVGAGKSVFATVLIVTLARRGYRIASLLNSVSSVMETVSLLRQAGIAASPLVSKSNRLQRLNELFDQDNRMLLDDSIACYLETPCLIDGLDTEGARACSYATTPCRGLQSEGGAAYACPYWDICPSQAMAREAFSSSVVVTTPSGFSLMTVGKGREAFFELALADFDLVLFDEADRVQSQLDGSFAPELSFQELIYNSADLTAAAMKRAPSTKMRDLDVEHFYDLRQSTEPVAKALLLSVKNAEVSSWRVVKNEAFTSLTLLKDLEEEGLPQAIVEDLDSRISGYAGSKMLGQAVALSCQGVAEDSYSFAFDGFLKEKDVALDATLKARLSFLLKVMRFDEFLRELAESSEALTHRDESMAELYNFLRFSNVRQQRYLPSSLIGNIFGMRMTDDNDLILFRQFAFGRAFMDSLPWLDTDKEGRPAGPHALLLSGSSYEPGCLQYHVNRPVDYLLEAQPWVADKLSASVVCDLGIDQHVSGSGRKYRQGNLTLVLSQLADALCMELNKGDGKALVIVNNYQEAEEAREKLEAALRKGGLAGKVCALTKSVREDKERFVPRAEVYKFASHPSRVLVAPALAIERGFNIVDDAGHAAFNVLVFAVRPMGVPHDLGMRYKRLNGLIEGQVDSYPDSPAEFAMKVREEAWACWKRFERDELIPPALWQNRGERVLARDTVATLMVTIVQIFGRLARLKDPDRAAPRVYFADAAFRGSSDKNVASFKTLEELGNYMADIIENSEQPAVARALYGPFYEAFKKGVVQ